MEEQIPSIWTKMSKIINVHKIAKLIYQIGIKMRHNWDTDIEKG